MQHKKSRGFTIIELLVALAIIGLLSASILVYLDTTRAKSRDVRRLLDMNEIVKALNLYYTGHQQYPVAATAVTITSSDSLSTTLESEKLISNVPIDPLDPVYAYTYQTNLTGSTFTLTFCMETSSNLLYTQGCTNTIRP